MRGTFDSPVISRGKAEIEAIVPVAASMDYPAAFASLTGGRGMLKWDACGYEICPPGLGAAAKRRGIDPRKCTVRNWIFKVKAK
jgi:ribosomal protection tetracycline resistance protein